MALRRAFSKVDKQCSIKLPSDIRRLTGLESGRVGLIMALRIPQTTRYPHAVLFTPENPPILSPFEVVMEKAQSVVDGDGQVNLPANVLEEMRLEPDYRIEMKVQGPHNRHWVVLYNRGPWIETTLRHRMGVDRGKPVGDKKHPTQVWEY